MAQLKDTSPRLAIYAILALLLVWPILAFSAHTNEFRDAQILSLYEHAAVDTVKRFGEFPFWNPYYCGGLDGLGTPQSRFASPGFLFSLIFGVERAEPILVFVLAFSGMEGTYRWLRLRTRELSAACVAPVFALSGHFAVAYFRGWTNFFGFELVPWILLGVGLAARGRLRGIWICAFAFTFLIGFGGTFAAPLVSVAMLGEAVRSFLERPRSERSRSLAMLATCASFSISLSAFRLWPLAETLYAAPRIMAGVPGFLPTSLLTALVDTVRIKDADTTFVGSFFVGAMFLAVVALGLADRRGAKGMAIAILFLWFAGGYARQNGPFPLLRELPVFAALRYPERFLWLSILFACEPAARAFDTIPKLGDGARWRQIVWTVLGGAILWTLVSEIGMFHRTAAARDLGGRAEVSAQAPFRQARGNRWLALHEQANGLGSLSCWETYPVPQSPLLRADLPAEEYPASPSTGRVNRVWWSPNRIVLDVDFAEPGIVRINQNWHQGWRASVGNVVSDQGLLAIEMPSGSSTVTLRFRPWSAMAGAAVSGATLLVLIGWTLRQRRGRRPFTRGTRWRSLAAMLFPFAVGGAAFQLSPEPRPRRAVPHNPDETPVLVESAPKGLEPIHAEYTGGLRIDGAKVTPPDVHGAVGVDVWLAREAPINRETAMMVRVVRRADQMTPPSDRDTAVSRNRQVLAGSFYISDAPANQLVHDSFGVNMTRGAKGIWDVWVGFGHFSSRQGRWPVKTTAPTKDDLVKVGTFVLY